MRSVDVVSHGLGQKEHPHRRLRRRCSARPGPARPAPEATAGTAASALLTHSRRRSRSAPPGSAGQASDSRGSSIGVCRAGSGATIKASLGRAAGQGGERCFRRAGRATGNAVPSVSGVGRRLSRRLSGAPRASPAGLSPGGIAGPRPCRGALRGAIPLEGVAEAAAAAAARGKRSPKCYTADLAAQRSSPGATIAGR